MKQHINKNIFVSWFIVILVLCWYSTSLASEEVENEREFEYAVGGKKGPEHWGEIHKEWKACKTGAMQSPVDMSSPRVKVIGKQETVVIYNPSNATVKNRGHDISIQWDIGKAGFVNINGTKYLVHQAHWHSPSEHSINGRRYDLELHLVHVKPDDNKLAVTAMLYKKGKPDPFLSQLMKNVTAMKDQVSEKKLGVINPSEIGFHCQKYYRYIGSLTVPPCTEGVIWTISSEVKTISASQVSMLRDVVHDYASQNARPMQLLNKRVVELMTQSP